METDKTPSSEQDQRTGTSGERAAQTNKLANIPEEDKAQIAEEIGEMPESVATLKDLGQLSGRDDLAGGSGDQMENQSTGEPTER